MANLKTRPRRRRAKSDTRERLLEAALDLLHQGGVSAVTTVSVTHAAEIVQSAFYKHFSNIEECLAVALEGVTSEIRAAVAGARQEMYDRGPGTGEDLEQSYRKMFELVKGQKPIVQLFLRYRSDPLALHGVMHQLARGLSDDLAGQLREQFALGGIAQLPAGWIEALADQLVAASFAAIEAFLEGRGPSVDESARILAVCSNGACLGVIESLRPRKS